MNKRERKMLGGIQTQGGRGEGWRKKENEAREMRITSGHLRNDTSSLETGAHADV